MVMSLSDGPHAFRCLPALRYGTVPGVPPDEAALYLDLLVPEPAPAGPTPVVVYFHGGGWQSGQRSEAMYPWLSPLLASHGFVTASVTYRLTGDAPYPAQIHDAKAAIRWLRGHAESYGIDPHRIGVWGDSAGGHLASLLGVTADVTVLEGGSGTAEQSSAVQAVVTRCAPSDMVTMVRSRTQEDPVLAALLGGPTGEHLENAELASPERYVGPGAPPFLVVHGTDDELVPFEQAESFVRTLREHDVDVSFHVVHGGHHNLRHDVDLPWSDEPWTHLGHQALEFFTKHLS